jgi:amino acid transporter
MAAAEGVTSVGDPTRGVAFVRKSSGLVKTGTPWRIFVMGFAVQGVGAWMALYYLSGVGAFPQTNLWLAFIAMMVLIQAFNVAIALIAAAYPRSGGDYVYLSRIFSPMVGFVINFGTFCTVCFFAVSGAFLLLTYGLAPALEVYGVIVRHPTWTSAGTWLANTDHAWLVSSLIVLAFGVLIVFGMKIFYQYQAITWWVGGALFVLMLVVYGVSSHATFVHGFNNYVLATAHQHNGYAQVMAAAKKAGVPHGYTLYDTLGMFAIATAISNIAIAWIGGEVRTPLRTQLLGGVGSGVAYWLVIFIITAIIASTTGFAFNKDATFLSVQHPTMYVAGQAPIFTFYAYLCTTSPVLLWLMMAGVVIIGAYLVPSQIMYPTRMLFAWSFDRLIPSRVADVSGRTNAPIIATIITILACEGLLALYGSGQITFINPILLFGTVCMAASIAAVVMPFMPKSRDLYKTSGIKREILGVPVITIGGILGVVFWGTALYVALSRDALGANAASNIRIWIGVFVIPAIYYLGAKWYRRREGINLSANFTELPPE